MEKEGKPHGKKTLPQKRCEKKKDAWMDGVIKDTLHYDIQHVYTIKNPSIVRKQGDMISLHNE